MQGRDPIPERFQSKLCSLETGLIRDVFPPIRLEPLDLHLIANPGDEPLAIDLSRTERRTPRRTGDHEPAKLPMFLAPLPQPSRVLDPDQWRKRLAWHASRPLGFLDRRFGGLDDLGRGLGRRVSRPLRFLWHWRRGSLLVLPDGLMERGCDAHERWSPFIYACLHS